MSLGDVRVTRVAPPLARAAHDSAVGVKLLPPDVIVNCALPVLSQVTGSLYVSRIEVAVSVVVLAIDGFVVSAMAVPVTVCALCMTLPARSWVLPDAPAEHGLNESPGPMQDEVAVMKSPD